MTAKRSLQNLLLHYSINGGARRRREVRRWEGGERYGDTHDDYYGEFRGHHRGTAWRRGRGVVHRGNPRRDAGPR